MRDDLTFVEKVERDLRDVRWPGPEEIRARARRRSRRTVAAVTAVLALAGASAVAAVAPGQSSAPPAASVEPGVPVRAEITTEALLRPADLGLGPAQTQLTESGLAEPIRIDEMLGACRSSKGLSQTWPSRWSRSQTLLAEPPDGADRAPGDVQAMQDVYRLAPGGAEAFLTDLDQIIAPCARWPSVGPYEWKGRTGTAEAVHQWRVVRRDFAGDGAAMVRHVVSPPRDVKTGETFGDVPQPTYRAIIRVGDLVAVLGLGRHGTESELIQLSTVAAARLCQAANPGC
ncbi:hypothetical protein E1211_26455 [Micromonospora sp. 15K316]|uniref:hypothetical protein n=1 Tax=Micromonospora sp. 15K316 TaxID=2530376 RepID=UPI00104E794C|nr:hypothetical protein [Micromonospora sp. 15K316]TDC29207.1 hypothetical protein E1211_26455 [Micromonospora sp. 15K316]